MIYHGITVICNSMVCGGRMSGWCVEGECGSSRVWLDKMCHTTPEPFPHNHYISFKRRLRFKQRRASRGERVWGDFMGVADVLCTKRMIRHYVSFKMKSQAKSYQFLTCSYDHDG